MYRVWPLGAYIETVLHYFYNTSRRRTVVCMVCVYKYNCDTFFILLTLLTTDISIKPINIFKKHLLVIRIKPPPPHLSPIDVPGLNNSVRSIDLFSVTNVQTRVYVLYYNNGVFAIAFAMRETTNTNIIIIS